MKKKTKKLKKIAVSLKDFNRVYRALLKCRREKAEMLQDIKFYESQNKDFNERKQVDKDV